MKRIVLLFLGLLLIGLFIRTPGIISNTILFLFDNGRDLLFVKKIVIDHDLILIGPSSGGIQGYFHGVWWYYLLAIPFAIGKGNPAVFTLFMALCSTGAIALASFVIYKMTKSVLGAFTAGTIFTFSLFSLATSRFIWNPYPIVWLMPLFFFGLFLFSQGKRYAIILLTFLAGWFMTFEAIYSITLIPVLLVCFVMELIRKYPITKKVQILLISLFAFLIPFTPTIIFDLRHDFLVTSSLTKAVTSGGTTITHGPDEKPLAFTQRLSLRAQDLVTYTVGSVSIPFVNIMLFLIALTGIWITRLYQNKQQRVLLLLTILPLITPFFLFLSLKYAVWGYYWIGNPPLYAMLLAYCIGIASQKHSLYRKSSLVAIVVVIVSFIPIVLIPHWKNGIIMPGSQTLTTQLAVVDTIYQDAGNNPFSVYVLTPPAYDYVYRYLFWWRGYYQYHRFPTEQKQRFTYLIIEHTPSDPDGIFFQKHVVKTDGKIEKVISFPDVRVKKVLTNQEEEPIDPNYFPQL